MEIATSVYALLAMTICNMKHPAEITLRDVDSCTYRYDSFPYKGQRQREWHQRNHTGDKSHRCVTRRVEDKAAA
jgi:hypothetical protein